MEDEEKEGRLACNQTKGGGGVGEIGRKVGGIMRGSKRRRRGGAEEGGGGGERRGGGGWVDEGR